MAPYLFALLLLAQDAATVPAPSDDLVATAEPDKPDVTPPPIQGGRVAPPTDDYGYVGWCYGALAGYVELYDRAMPDVERIERAWPTPSTEENIKVIYPGQRAEAKATLPVLKRAMEAAEKASPTPIQKDGSAAIKKGRAIWTGATTVPTAQLAQFWMSWMPPSKCEKTAKTLEARSNVFGQALSANVETVPAEIPVVSAEATVEEPAEVAASSSGIDDLAPGSVDAQPADAVPADEADVATTKPEEAPADLAQPEEVPPLRGPQ